MRYCITLSFLLLALSIATLFQGCGEIFQPQSPISDEEPHVVPECEPKPVSDAGGDAYIIVKPDAPDFAFIGTPGVPGTQYEWSPSDGLESPNSPETMASPKKKTVYVLTAKNKCGVAKSGVTVHVLGPVLMSDDSFSVKAKDVYGVEQQYFTGYVPSPMEHYRAQYLHMPKDGLGFRAAPEELKLTPPNFHVNRQPNGSCWAEGARSAAEAGLFYIMKKAVHVSTQRIIDCSGFGSASSGGQISIDDFLPPKGVVYEADYPYTGYDQRCKKDAPFRERAERTYIVRNESGGKPSWPDIKNATAAFGMMEVCGSAGALGDGGWDPSPGGGATNHCWANFGYLKGELHGQEPGDYIVYQNSWGTNWGGGTDLAPGQGAYRVAPNGIDIKGALLVENKVAVFGSPCPPPVADGGPDKTILQIPGTSQSVRIGTQPVVGQSYKWSPVVDYKADGTEVKIIDNPASPMPIVSPIKSTVFTVETKNSCATVSAKVTVRVYADQRGLIELGDK